jgi:uncharacterized BrkB/YihY/UPF0761 family membrane protein
MKLGLRDIVGILVGVTFFYFYVSNTRPVGWFDSVVGIILFAVGFWFVKNFRGLKR